MSRYGRIEAVLDELPDDSCHLVAVEFDDRIVDLDLCHVAALSVRFELVRYL